MEIEPLIWRRIEVPSNYNFWDLHVAIQDSMGWLDYHVHSFNIVRSIKRKAIEIGIPHNEYENNILAGWETLISQYFKELGDEATYEYDFGDGWQHHLIFEGLFLQKENATYPQRTGGERACPPEDCGGIPGYYHLLEVLNNPAHKEFDDMVHWLSNHAKNYHPYNPEHFGPSEVKFWNPKKRWKIAFGPK